MQAKQKCFSTTYKYTFNSGERQKFWRYPALKAAISHASKNYNLHKTFK